jgi:hypothetical protein
VLLVHNDIHYVPIGDGWREVLVCNVIHYIPVLLPPMVRSQCMLVSWPPGRGQILCNYSTPPPRACMHGYLHYSIVGGGGGGLPQPPPPPEYLLTQHICKETSPPLLHTTTLHNSTRVHKTTNVPVVFMALVLNGFEGCNIITRGIGRGGPWKSRLFWALKWHERNGPQKVEIKTTGTLIVCVNLCVGGGGRLQSTVVLYMKLCWLFLI